MAQPTANKLSGEILDEKTKEPLVGVNVYINNSTVGTSTNKQGRYELKLPDGRYEIVASIIGYEIKSEFIIIKGGMHIYMDFALKEKTYELSQVEIRDRHPKEWYEKLEIFKEFFLGNNEFSRLCTIENENDIYFKGNIDSIFTVYSYNPLTVINGALGYVLECAFINFECDKRNMASTFIIKTRFTDLAQNENSSSKTWITNRNSAYVGSLRHFLYTILNKNSFDDFDVSLVNEMNFKENRIRVLNKDEIFISDDSKSEYLLSFDKYLKVKYKSRNICSWIKLDKENTQVNNNGYLVNPMSVTQFGDWAFFGMSKALPMDFISF